MLIIVKMVTRASVVRNTLKTFMDITLIRNIRIEERKWPIWVVSPGVKQK